MDWTNERILPDRIECGVGLVRVCSRSFRGILIGRGLVAKADSHVDIAGTGIVGIMDCE